MILPSRRLDIFWVSLSWVLLLFKFPPALSIILFSILWIKNTRLLLILRKLILFFLILFFNANTLKYFLNINKGLFWKELTIYRELYFMYRTFELIAFLKVSYQKERCFSSAVDFDKTDSFLPKLCFLRSIICLIEMIIYMYIFF